MKVDNDPKNFVSSKNKALRALKSPVLPPKSPTERLIVVTKALKALKLPDLTPKTPTKLVVVLDSVPLKTPEVIKLPEALVQPPPILLAHVTEVGSRTLLTPPNMNKFVVPPNQKVVKCILCNG